MYRKVFPKILIILATIVIVKVNCQSNEEEVKLVKLVNSTIMIDPGQYNGWISIVLQRLCGVRCALRCRLFRLSSNGCSQGYCSCSNANADTSEYKL